LEDGKEEQGRDGKMYSSPSLSETSFSAKNAPKTLAAGLRSDPLGELKLSHRPLISSEGYGREYSLAAIRGLCGEGEG